MRREITVIETAGVGAFVRGPGARDLLLKLTRRTPVRTATGWAIQKKQIADLVALAESRGYAVVVVDETEVSPR